MTHSDTRFDDLKPSQFGAMFNRLNRVLTSAETAAQWEPAIAEMTAFLDILDQKLFSKPEVIAANHSELSRVFSMLLTLAAVGTQYRLEQFKPKDEATREKRREIDQKYIPAAGQLRKEAITLAKKYLGTPVFDSLRDALDYEIIPLLDSLDFEQDPDRWMPFRVVQIGNIYERLYSFRLRTTDTRLVGAGDQPGLLRKIYDRKYLRFGTSGVRGKWGADLTEERIRGVVQAVCDFLNDEDVPDYVDRENLAGKKIVIGYDTRRNADLVAEWAAEVCLGNGFKVEFANRDTPTPALVYYLTDYLPPDEVAGLLICTASHNPPEWQGIKFNPHLGYPAPTSVTDFLALRINELQLVDADSRTADLANAREQGRLNGFDPLDDYVAWIKDNGNGNARIPIDLDRIRRFLQRQDGGH